MKNLDTLAQQKATIVQKLNDAVAAGDTEKFNAAFTEFTELLQQAVMAEAKGLIQSNDNAILSGRGARALTSEENAYYQKAIDAMRGSNPKQALADLNVVMPKTIIDTVFEDLQEEHPLLGHIDFQNTGALVEIIVSTASGVAGWGDLTAEISDELAASFSKMELALKKLSAFIPVAKAMLDLGPAWLDRYVRTILAEALVTGLEAALVDGDGKDGPLGMTRALSGAVDGAYPRKTAVTVNALDPATIGTILNTVSMGPNNKRRNVPRLLMVVNPADYFTKVFPATTVRATDGSFNANTLPYPMDVVVSAAMPDNHAVFGLAKRYFMGMGTSKGGKLEFSDDYKFLEDQRVYLIKLYGNGRAKDANAFVYANISGLLPVPQQVYVVNADEFTGLEA